MPVANCACRKEAGRTKAAQIWRKGPPAAGVQQCRLPAAPHVVGRLRNHGDAVLGLVRAHHQRDLLGFFDVIDGQALSG